MDGTFAFNVEQLHSSTRSIELNFNSVKFGMEHNDSASFGVEVCVGHWTSSSERAWNCTDSES